MACGHDFAFGRLDIVFKQMQQCKRTTNTGMFSAFSTTAGVGLLNEVYEAPRYCCGCASQGGITIASTTDLGPFPAPGWGSNTLPPGPSGGGGGGGGGGLCSVTRGHTCTCLVCITAAKLSSNGIGSHVVRSAVCCTPGPAFTA